MLSLYRLYSLDLGQHKNPSKSELDYLDKELSQKTLYGTVCTENHMNMFDKFETLCLICLHMLHLGIMNQAQG